MTNNCSKFLNTYLCIYLKTSHSYDTSQTEKLVTQLSKSCGMLCKLKHYTNTIVLKSVCFAIFHSYSSYSILDWGRANRTTLLHRCTRGKFLGDANIFCPNLILLLKSNINSNLNVKTKMYHCKQIRVSTCQITNRQMLVTNQFVRESQSCNSSCTN